MDKESMKREQGDVFSYEWVKVCMESNDNTLTKQRVSLVKEYIKNPAIDIACNTGGMSIYCGCDLAIDFIKKHLVKLRSSKRDIECIQACAEYLPIRNKSFETSVFTEIIEHVNNPELALSEACRVGKQLIFSTPLVYIPYHIRVYEYEEILNLITKFINPSIIKILQEGNNKLIFIYGVVNE